MKNLVVSLVSDKLLFSFLHSQVSSITYIYGFAFRLICMQYIVEATLQISQVINLNLTLNNKSKNMLGPAQPQGVHYGNKTVSSR